MYINNYNHSLILVARNFEELVYGRFFEIYRMVFKQFQRHFLLYGHPLTIPKTIPNTTTLFPITTFILTTTSLFVPIHQKGYEKAT
jgi:hypothetical protein